MHIDNGSRHLIIHPTRPRWTLVNDLGLEVLQLCDGQRSLEQMAQIIAARYDQPADRVLPDVADFVAALQRSDFMSAEPPARSDSGETSTLKTLHISVTTDCNLRCVHCAVIGSKGGCLDQQEVKRIINEFVALGGTDVVISGGEPLVRPDALELLRHGAAQARTRLLTNATLISQRQAKELADLGMEIQISLDGADAQVHDAVRGPGAFARAMRGIELLLERGAGNRLCLCMTLMRSNMLQVPDVIGLAERLGIGAVRFLPLQPLGFAQRHWHELCPAKEECEAVYRYLYQAVPRHGLSVRLSGGLAGFVLGFGQAERWCDVGKMLFVDADGSVYPCVLMAEECFRLGNIRQQSLQQIIASSTWRDLVGEVASREEVIPECQACLWRNFCQGSCPASVFIHKGSLLATDDMCEFRRQLYQDVIFDLTRQRAVDRPSSWGRPCS